MAGVGELIGFGCAAVAAFGNALANVMQRKASLEQPPDRPFGAGLMTPPGSPTEGLPDSPTTQIPDMSRGHFL